MIPPQQIAVNATTERRMKGPQKLRIKLQNRAMSFPDGLSVRTLDTVDTKG
jgi:hypothetical protein